MALTHIQAMAALAAVVEPDLQRDLVTLDLVRDLTLDGADVRVKLALATPVSPHRAALEQAVGAALRKAGAREVAVTFAPEQPRGEGKLATVTHVVGVGAGKGGVGKSTVAVNLAVTLAQLGARVGLLDADMYGPSVPIMLGLKGGKPSVNDKRRIIPLQAHGISCISIGFLVQDDMAVAWRGPMIGRAVTQFAEDVEWGELDYLIVDLPPGTGDVILSLCQALPLAGALVVSTPQDVAFADVLRAARMFAMLKVDVIGLVENMSYFRCPDNGKDYEIFGPSHSAGHANAHDLPFLGQLPIDMAVSPAADRGQPIAVAAPDSVQSEGYRLLARKVALALAERRLARKDKTAVGKGFFTTRPA
jgi:ATP-binding protein involved in chromosome partitioning